MFNKMHGASEKKLLCSSVATHANKTINKLARGKHTGESLPYKTNETLISIYLGQLKLWKQFKKFIMKKTCLMYI